jgi:hypothetical protein
MHPATPESQNSGAMRTPGTKVAIRIEQQRKYIPENNGLNHAYNACRKKYAASPSLSAKGLAVGAGMEPMSILMSVWAVLTAVLAVLLIYRSALSMHEDDQLFLNSSESQLEQDQRQVMARMNRVRPLVNVLGASSGLLVLMMAGLWVWRGWTRM